MHDKKLLISIFLTAGSKTNHVMTAPANFYSKQVAFLVMCRCLARFVVYAMIHVILLDTRATLRARCTGV